jgi:hypothetical protein
MRPTLARALLKSELTAPGTIGTSWMSTAAGPPELDIRTVSNIGEDSDIQQGYQQQQQQLTTRTLATAAETIGTSQTSTAEGRPAVAEMPEIVLTSAGTPTAQYGREQLMSFCGNSRKSRQSCKKFVKKVTISILCVSIMEPTGVVNTVSISERFREKYSIVVFVFPIPRGGRFM